MNLMSTLSIFWPQTTDFIGWKNCEQMEMEKRLRRIGPFDPTLLKVWLERFISEHPDCESVNLSMIEHTGGGYALGMQEEDKAVYDWYCVCPLKPEEK